MPELLSQFHFIRPLWLLALLLLPVWVLLYRRTKGALSGWSQVIDAPLLQHLLVRSLHQTRRWPLYLILLSWILASIALAGPAWKKLPQPVFKNENALVLVVDESLSMLVEDLDPSRQIRMRYKLTDLLDRRIDGQTALVVYAGDAHTVVPLTDDTETIKAMIPSLSPVIMPVMGSRPVLGIEQALELLKDAGINQGRILLVTDGIREFDVTGISQLIQQTGHQLDILAVGTQAGGPIPLPEQGFLKQNGEIVVAGLDLAPLQELAGITGGRLLQLQLTDQDLDLLLAADANPVQENMRQVNREFDQWQEEGPWLLLLLLPLVALGFRKGWLFSLALFCLVQPQPSYAWGWDDLWQRPDQQGAEAFQAGDYALAQKLFENPDWQGTSAYRDGDYQQALEDFSQTQSADSAYNQGNSLAKAGQLQQAIKAYQEALRLNPEDEDARFNRDLVQKILDQQQQNQSGSGGSEQQDQQRSDSQQSDSDQSNNSQSDSSDQQDNAQSSPSASQDPSQQNRQNQSGQSDQQTDQTQQDSQNSQQSADNTEQSKDNKDSSEQSENRQQQDLARDNASDSDQDSQSLAASEMSEAEQQEADEALEKWLRRVPDDPAGLLRRKFQYQYQQSQLNNQFVPQDPNVPLW